MPRQTKAPAKDPSVIAFPWLDPEWMEKADFFGSRIFDQISKAQVELLDKSETLFEDHLSFVRGRVHSDFECAKSLSEARDPVEVFQVMSAFWEKTFADYSANTETNGAKLREIVARCCENGMQIAETSGEAASSAEVALDKMMKPATKTD